MNSAEGFEAVNFMAGLRWVHGVVPQPGEVSGHPFYNGQVGMYLDGSWAPLRYNQNVDFEYDVTFFPAGPAGRWVSSTGGHWSINAATEHPEEAWRFLKYLTSTEANEIMISRHLRSLPGRRSAVAEWLRSAEVAGSPKSAHVFVETVERHAAFVPPVLYFWDDLLPIVSRYMNEVLNGQMDVRVALEQIEREGNAAIADVLARWGM